MSNAAEFKVDSKDVESILSKLTGTALAALNRRAAQSAAKELKERVKAAFQAALPAAGHSNPNYIDVMLDAVRQGSNATNQSTETEGRAVVSIFGVRTKGSMTFMARFYEGGTRERGTEKEYKRSDGSTRHLNVHGRGKSQRVDENWKPHRRGSLNALHFLENTSRNFEMQSSVEETLEKYISAITRQ